MAPGQASVDQRKRKRMESNRESARRSRLRKQQHVDDMTGLISRLRSEKNQLVVHINTLAEQYWWVESENMVLRSQLVELAQRLRSANSVLRFYEEFSGVEMEIQEEPDPTAKQWRLPYLSPAIVAPMLDVFRC